VIIVGALEPDDRPAWETLFAGYHDFYGRPAWPRAGYDRAWREFQEGDRMRALGARLDGQLAGIAHFLVHPSTTSADVCYLQDLFTAPEARGQGVARALIAAVREWASGQGCARVYWHTQATNDTARRLYDQVAENRGFIQYVIQL
jgi:GNAT superfamily N-acetyltransferase